MVTGEAARRGADAGAGDAGDEIAEDEDGATGGVTAGDKGAVSKADGATGEAAGRGADAGADEATGDAVAGADRGAKDTAATASEKNNPEEGTVVEDKVAVQRAC
ncbi:hypothetical protein X472_00779 [Bartonella bacilliformis San Pedro600-02]|nr:hypothetical protein X472_00779 [Bartonella bacilliformis San Pedro600-02]KEG17520.1 hypothetical protein H705_00171 [Bartonella bacilliformis Cond044]